MSFLDFELELDWGLKFWGSWVFRWRRGKVFSWIFVGVIGGWEEVR